MTSKKPVHFFLHIPKNSGTTLNSVIRNNYFNAFKVSWDKHDQNHCDNILATENDDAFIEYDIVRGHFPYGLHKALKSGESYSYFTMLREPLKRTWSQYNYMCGDNSYINKNPDLKIYLNDLTLEQYCREDHPLVPNHVYTDNAQVRYLSGVGGTKPFGKIDEADLAKAKQNLALMYFGIVEDFDRSMLYLQSVLGWRKIFYTKQKIGSRVNSRPTDKEKKVLNACNHFDIQLYDYGLSLFGDRSYFVSEENLNSYRYKLAVHQSFHRYKFYSKRLVRNILNKFNVY